MIELSPMVRRARRPIRERDVERYLVRKVEALGGTCEKFTSPARRSVPDRLILWPDGSVDFVECKAPGEKPTEAQLRDHARRRQLGHIVVVVDSFESVDKYLTLEGPL